MTEIITRKQLKDLLMQWRNGELSEEQLHDWAENRYLTDEVDYSDWENDNSVTNEVLGALDMMNMNLMTKEDIESYLTFLDTPPGQFSQGYGKLEDYLKMINYSERKRTLAKIPFYKKFCG